MTKIGKFRAMFSFVFLIVSLIWCLFLLYISYQPSKEFIDQDIPMFIFVFAIISSFALTSIYGYLRGLKSDVFGLWILYYMFTPGMAFGSFFALFGALSIIGKIAGINFITVFSNMLGGVQILGQGKMLISVESILTGFDLFATALVFFGMIMLIGIVFFLWISMLIKFRKDPKGVVKWFLDFFIYPGTRDLYNSLKRKYNFSRPIMVLEMLILYFLIFFSYPITIKFWLYILQIVASLG